MILRGAGVTLPDMLDSMISRVMIPPWCRCLYDTAGQRCRAFLSWLCWIFVVYCFSPFNRYHPTPKYCARALSDQRMLDVKWLRNAPIRCPSNQVVGVYPRPDIAQLNRFGGSLRANPIALSSSGLACRLSICPSLSGARFSVTTNIITRTSS